MGMTTIASPDWKVCRQLRPRPGSLLPRGHRLDSSKYPSAAALINANARFQGAVSLTGNDEACRRAGEANST
jgi:hypothetical protein